MRYKIAGHVIEVFSDKVIIDKKNVTEQDKIIRAFALFLQSENNIITKDTLMQELWGDLIVSDDSLFKIVQELRKILSELNFPTEILVNVYGKGYKINPPIKVCDKKVASSRFTNVQLFVVLAILIGLGLLTYGFLFHAADDQLTAEQYIEYREKAKSNAENIKTLIQEKYKNIDLTPADKIRKAYLFAYADYKKGYYTESQKQTQKAIKISTKSESIIATADAYLLSALINYYRNNHTAMKYEISSARHIFEQFNDTKSLCKADYLLGKYYIGIHDYDASIKMAKSLIIETNPCSNTALLLKNYVSLYENYFIQGDNQESEKWADQILQQALKIHDGNYISIGYNLKSMFSLLKGDFGKAMKYAQLTIRYAIDQNDTNNFQQSFSSFYNILNVLGHRHLAEKYLTKAIEFQNNRNSDGHLDEAELNLGIVYLQNQHYEKAQHLFEQILDYQIPVKNQLDAKAWLALTKFFKDDAIAAYALAKEVYKHPKSTDSNKIIAGISLILSDYSLERKNEMQLILEQIEHIDMTNLLIEKSFFLDAVLSIYADDDVQKYHDYLSQKQAFDERLNNIRTETLPALAFLRSLDAYLEKESKPQ